MRQPKQFQAATLAEAYDRVRRELGSEAVILSTRKAYAPGLFGQPGRQFVEVIAHVPGDETAPASQFDMGAAAHDLVRDVAEATASRAAAERELAPPLTSTLADRMVAAALAPDRAGQAESPDSSEPTGGSSAEAMSALSQRIDEMRSLLEGLVSERSNARVEGGPRVLRELRDRLVRQGLASTHTLTLLEQAGGSIVRPDDAASVARTVERRLASWLPPVPRLDLSRRPAVVCLVGPAGAGKTTMAVRLALEIERAHRMNVVIAGTDVTRAGAPQQLAAFGSATGLAVQLCYAPSDLQALIDGGSADVVIVDTPGHNGRRRDRMAELSAYLQAPKRKTTLLVLPATMKAQDMGDAASTFGGLGLDGLVFTRCDETSSYGALASVAIDAATGVAYTTHSDQVGDAPRAGDHAALAGAVMAGRWTPPTRSLAPSAAGRLAAAV